jgi:hypothetical protein
MLSLLTSSKEHRNGERGFHKLDYAGPAFSCTPCFVSKTLWGNEMRVPEACDALAPRLQRNLSYVANPGVGRLRRAEAGSGGRAMGGQGGPPFFLQRHTNAVNLLYPLE